MQRDMKQQDREYMKNAMLNQEEMFKCQVQELHRLYKIQKQLMRELKNAEMEEQRKEQQASIELWNAQNEIVTNQPPCLGSTNPKKPRPVFDLELPAEEYIGQHRGEAMLDADEESDLELKLSTGSSGGGAQSKKKNACAKPFASDSGSSFSSSSNESRSMKQNSKEWMMFQMPDISARLSNDRKAGFVFEEQRRKDVLKQSPWLFPCSKQDMIVSFGL